MALLDNLVSFWKADEAGGNLLDSHSTNDLTETSGTIASVAGKIVNARLVVAADTEYFSKADNAALSIGTADFTIQVWVKLTSKATAPNVNSIVGKWTGLTNYEYALYYDGTTDRFSFIVTDAGNFVGTFKVVTADNLGSPALDTWYLLHAWLDTATLNVVGISVNAGTPDTQSYGDGAFDGTSAFTVGSHDGGSYLDGAVDEIGLWKRVLTSQERTDLYALGVGLGYPFSALSVGTLSATAQSSTSVSLAQTTTSGGTAPYSTQLQRSPHSAATWSSIGSPSASTTPTFTDGTVAANTDYDYRAVTTDDASATATSNTVRVLTRDARIYYFATSGSDSNTGAVGSPYQTITKANSVKLTGGDSFLFNRGDTFSGNLIAQVVGGGLTPSAISPCVLTAYGTGADPIISCGDGHGIKGINLPYTTVSEFKVQGSGVTLIPPGVHYTVTYTTAGMGIWWQNTSTATLAGVVITDNEVVGTLRGIVLGDWSASQTHGFDGFICSRNTVHQIVVSGIDCDNYLDWTPTIHLNGTFADNEIYDIYGGDDQTLGGFPLTLFATTGTIALRNRIHDNGIAGDISGVLGTTALELAGAVSCIVRSNVILRQYTQNGLDGQGIDVDGNNSSGNILEKNDIADCDGDGIALLTIDGATAGTIIRFNIIEGCKNGLDIIGGTGTVCHNNTIFQTGSGKAVTSNTALKLYNNCIITGAGATIGDVPTGTDVEGNLYDCSTFSFTYNSSTYASLALFRTGSSEESSGHGFATAADLRDAGNGPANPATASAVTAYDPATTASAVVGTGLDISSLFSVNPGTTDYHGRSNHPLVGYAIGAVVLPASSYSTGGIGSGRGRRLLRP